MKLLFVIGPDFVYWPLSISQYIKNKVDEACFCGLVIAPTTTYQMVEQQKEPLIQPLILLDTLENDWLKRSYDLNKLLEYEKILGENIINDLIIADRFLGNEFVSGGATAKTPLTKETRSRDKQLSYINGLLDFLFEFLQNEKPSLIFLPAVASAPTLALCKVANYLGIPFRALIPARFEKLYILDNSLNQEAPELAELYNKALEESSILEDYFAIAQKKLLNFREKPEAPEYWSYWYNFMKSPPLLKDTLALIYRTIQRRKPEVLVYPYPFHRLFQEWKRFLLYSRYILSKKQFSNMEDLKNKKYIYFPLHIDPESSTMVLAPNYTDQLAIIERLSKSIPVDTILAVKEHFPMLGKRPLNYYKKIRSFTNVKLISPFVSSFKLVQNAKLTIVITGTAGFESILLQKPTLCLGKSLYHIIKNGFIYCKNPNELPQKIREAFNCKIAHDKEIITYLACLLKEGFECNSEYLGINVSSKMVENSMIFIETISEKLIKIGKV